LFENVEKWKSFHFLLRMSLIIAILNLEIDKISPQWAVAECTQTKV